jgi:hypothetical protein
MAKPRTQAPRTKFIKRERVRVTPDGRVDSKDAAVYIGRSHQTLALAQ